MAAATHLSFLTPSFTTYFTTYLTPETLIKYMEKELTIRYRVCGIEELTKEDRELMEAAIEATDRAYAPYSKFHVGAAVRVEENALRDVKRYHVGTGNNQENIAYPSGLCAERTALFAASAAYPDAKVTALAIVGRNAKGELTGAMPCGACRQVMAEQQMRQGCPMRVLCFKRFPLRDAKDYHDPLRDAKDYHDPLRDAKDYHDGVMVFDGIESLLPFGFEM